jgi:hypothetical protein
MTHINYTHCNKTQIISMSKIEASVITDSNDPLDKNIKSSITMFLRYLKGT